MNDDSSEQQIQSRLRELTTETRKLRKELEDMIRRPPDRGGRGLSNDRTPAPTASKGSKKR